MTLSSNAMHEAVRAVAHAGATLASLPESSLRVELARLTRAWRHRMRLSWESHLLEVAQGAQDAAKWDFVTGIAERTELHALVALIREVSWRTLHLRHFDVQIAAGLALVDNQFVDMKTGEGKTIVALMPAVYHGLLAQCAWDVSCQSDPTVPRPCVHVITANSYLARRDAFELKPVYSWFGLAVDALEPLDGLSEERGVLAQRRQMAHRCDVVYGTVEEVGFDYLRDNAVTRRGDTVLGQMHCAILDEVDHILIDVASTPLILAQENPAKRAMEVGVARLFGKFRVLHESPSALALHPDGTIGWSALGADALQLLVRDMLVDPADERRPNEEAQLVSLCDLLLRQLVEIVRTGRSPAEDGYVERRDGRLTLTPAGRRAVDAAFDSVEGSPKESWRRLREDLALAFRNRDVILHIAQVSQAEARMAARALPRLLLNSSRYTSRNLLLGYIDCWIDQIGTAVADSDLGVFEDHVAVWRQLAHSCGFANSAATNDDGPSVTSEREQALEGNLSTFAADTERFVLRTAFSAVSAFVDKQPASVRPAMRVMARLVIAMFTSYQPNRDRDRDLSGVMRSLGGQAFVPTFYTPLVDADEIVLNPLGRAVVRQVVREIITADLWPGRERRREESVEDAVQRLTPEAEELCRLCLRARHYYERDRQYLVHNGSIVLISGLTGFAEPGRRYGGLISAFLEEKEQLSIEGARTAVGRVSVQQMARMYRQICGMSASASLAGKELRTLRNADVVQIPPHRRELYLLANFRAKGIGPRAWLNDDGRVVKSDEMLLYLSSSTDLPRAFAAFMSAIKGKRRTIVFAKDSALIDDLAVLMGSSVSGNALFRSRCECFRPQPDVVFRSVQEKLEGAALLVEALHNVGQPVLVSVPSIRAADEFAGVLARRNPGIQPARLDARPEVASLEAEVIARAGEVGRVTIATQMAGRGIDIVVSPTVLENGGLYVLGLERRESLRWDTQLAGRTARQGDLGYATFYVSLGDELLEKLAGTQRVARLMERLGAKQGEILSSGFIDRPMRAAQRNWEARQAASRLLTAQIDEELDAIRQEVFALRRLTLSSTHPCLGQHTGSTVPEVYITNAHALCEACRGAGTVTSAARMRPEIRLLIAYAIDECLEARDYVRELVHHCVVDGAEPGRWNWRDLLEELTRLLGRPVAIAEIATQRTLSEKALLLANRRRYVPGWLYDVAAWGHEPDRGDKVNLKNGERPWAERYILEERIRVLIESAYVDKCLASVFKDQESGPFDAAQTYAACVLRLDECGVPALLGTYGEFASEVTNIGHLHGYVRRRLRVGFAFAPMPSGRSRARRVAQRTAMESTLRVFALDLSASDATEGEGSESASDVRRRSQELVGDAYERLWRTHGKPTLYECENRALRAAIDEHWTAFIAGIDDIESRRPPFHVEDRVRETRVLLRREAAALRRAIAGTFLGKLDEEVRRVTRSGERHEQALRRASVLVPLETDALCPCKSGADFWVCCGAGLIS